MIMLLFIFCSLSAQLAFAHDRYATVLAEQLNQYCAVHGARGGENGIVNYTKVKEMIVQVVSEMQAHDCTDASGVTMIYTKYFPGGTIVYCDAISGDGNWIVFQRRQDGSVNFTRNWADYVNGFGNLEGEYWMGLEKLHRLTSNGNHELSIDLEDWEGNRRCAKYSTFSVGSSSDNYRLRVDGYSGTPGDSMFEQDNQQFSSYDRDNDKDSSFHCSQEYQGGWWFNACFQAHLNGVYRDQREEAIYVQGIIWNEWKGWKYSLKFAEMKFRRKQD